MYMYMFSREKYVEKLFYQFYKPNDPRSFLKVFSIQFFIINFLVNSQ